MGLSFTIPFVSYPRLLLHLPQSPFFYAIPGAPHCPRMRKTVSRTNTAPATSFLSLFLASFRRAWATQHFWFLSHYSTPATSAFPDILYVLLFSYLCLPGCAIISLYSTTVFIPVRGLVLRYSSPVFYPSSVCGLHRVRYWLVVVVLLAYSHHYYCSVQFVYLIGLVKTCLCGLLQNTPVGRLCFCPANRTFVSSVRLCLYSGSSATTDLPLLPGFVGWDVILLV